MNDWYKGMTVKDVQGLHVLAIGKDDSRLEGRVDNDGVVSGNDVFEIDESTSMRPVKGLVGWVKQLTVSWDERYWEQIPVDDVQKGDAVVVGGIAYPVRKIKPRKGTGFEIGCRFKAAADDDACVPKDITFPKASVSYAIRRRPEVKIPSEQGMYKGHDGSLWLVDKDRNIIRLKGANGQCRAFDFGKGAIISPAAYPCEKAE